MASLRALGFIGIFLTIGWLLAYAGVVQYRQKTLIEDTPTSKIRSIALGRVEIQGRAEAVAEPFEAPFAGDACVLYHYRIERYSQSNDSSNWVTVESGTEMRGFYVNDGTGRVLVNPDDADLDVVTNVYEVGASEADPQRVRAFLDEREARFDEHRTDGLATVGQAQFDVEADGMRVGDASPVIENRRRRRYVEAYVPVGADVYVFGKATERAGASTPDNAANVVVGDADDIPRFTVTTGTRDDAVATSAKRTWSLLAFGLVFVGFAFVALVVAAEPFVSVVVAAVTLGIAYAGRGIVDIVQFGSQS